ncbi:MAG: DNA-binding response regulator [Nitrospirae bacterium]|nr:MAG: DNA-binding response regulator [Nitrospirota bacterium]
MARPRILIADDHTLVLEGLRKLLEESYDVVGTVEDGRALVEASQRLAPDLIVADVSMPLLNGLEAARRIKKILPHVKVIFLTMHPDTAYAREAFRIGASGYLLKRSAAAELSLAIQAALSDQVYITPSIAKNMVMTFLDADAVSSSPLARLTPRQREVLQLVAEGKSTKEIATILNLSIKTVEFHKSHIMRELNLHTTAELTKFAMAHGLVALE